MLKEIAVTGLALAIAIGLPAARAAEQPAARLRTLEPRLVCAASDAYCKVAMEVAYTYPRGVPQQDPVDIECLARVALRAEPGGRETVQVFRRALSVRVRYGVLDQPVEIPLPPAADTTSMQVMGVECRAA